MKRKQPKPPARCVTCGGEKRASDDRSDDERTDPRCWICRMLPMVAPPNGREARHAH
jgi:hypothetical protein